jgi:predicted  nucleic acid-binding Zn-ribbon protein
MPEKLVCQISPEEEELTRKREELAKVRAEVADRELELADLQRELAGFQAHYMRQVGVLYAELDDWRARIAELRVELEDSEGTRERAHRAREEARNSYDVAHGTASKSPEFQVTPELRNLFRDVAKRVHPDFATDSEDERRRTRAMVRANEAYSRGDVDALRRILDEFVGISEEIPGENIGAELVRIIRQIAHARRRLAAIEEELKKLHSSEIALLQRDVETASKEDRDLLAELAQKVQQQIARAKRDHETIVTRIAQKKPSKAAH